MFKIPDYLICPLCDRPTDNGHDRCVPPNPYVCSDCGGRYWDAPPEKEVHDLDK